MNIKRLYHRILGIALLCGTLAPTLCSCEDEDTYAKMRERENSQISNFLQRGTRVVNDEGEVLLDVPGPIKVISESQFYAMYYSEVQAFTCKLFVKALASAWRMAKQGCL